MNIDINRIGFVTNGNKKVIENYLDFSLELEDKLKIQIRLIFYKKRMK